MRSARASAPFRPRLARDESESFGRGVLLARRGTRATVRIVAGFALDLTQGEARLELEGDETAFRSLAVAPPAISATSGGAALPAQG